MSPLQSVHSPDASRHASAESPLMVLLHGYGSHERDLPGLLPYLPPMPWVSVRAPQDMPGGGAAWFPLSLPDEPSQDAIDASTALLWEWIDDEVIEGRSLIPVGFSQGGLMALQLLRTRPERIAATVVLAGFVTEAPQPADARLAQQRPPVFWGRGEADAIVWPAAIARTEALLPTISTPTARRYRGLGHSVDERMLADVGDFLAANTRIGS